MRECVINKWIKGKISYRKGNVLYLIELEIGAVHKRHTYQSLETVEIENRLDRTNVTEEMIKTYETKEMHEMKYLIRYS